MLDISQPTRQSKLAILFYFFKGIKGLITVVLFSSLSMRSWNNSLVILSVSVFIFLITLMRNVF